MKNIIKLKKKQNVALVPADRITNTTVEARRQEILEKGRKFKYPVQYSKHKLDINAIVISTIAAAIGAIALWYQLYKVQNTGTFIYRVSLFAPVSVADIDGEKALYSDYLAQYRSNISVTEKQEGPLASKEDEKRRSDYYKRQSMDNIIANTFAIKLAKEYSISVSDEEIEEVFNEHRKTSNSEISESAFNKIIEDNYGLSPREYRRMFIELPLLRKKVTAHIDGNAKQLQSEVVAKLKANDNDFAKTADQFGGRVEMSAPGFVKLTNIDGGRTQIAATLSKGQVSKPFISRASDGYYIVKLLDKKDDEVSYAYIKIPFTEFNKHLESIKSEGKIKEYISVPEVSQFEDTAP